jgi:hypothetical protein
MQIYSCSCDKKYTCGSLSNESLAWLNQYVNDTIAFKNAIGNQIKFIVTNRTVSPAYEEACFYNGLGCQCEYNCEANGRFYALGDTMINGENSYSISIEESGITRFKSPSNYVVRMLDFFGQYNIKNSSNNSSMTDSLLPTLQLGNITYSDVYCQTVDTTLSYFKDRTVWKIYFTKSLGVIGFKERYFHSTFYR